MEQLGKPVDTAQENDNLKETCLAGTHWAFLISIERTLKIIILIWLVSIFPFPPIFSSPAPSPQPPA
jgi:hypothetical protein